MKNFRKRFSFIISILISSLVLLLLLLISLFSETHIHWTFIFIFFFFSFILISLLLDFVIRSFIFERLSKILDALVIYRNNKESRKTFPLGKNVIEDISDEVKGWADDRKNEAERLKKLELYRKEYIGNISHELKTPVFNIQGYILTLLDGGLDDKKVNREYLVRAEKSVERMINMIEDLESISQLETGELTLERERFDIIALVNDVFEAHERNATAKGIILSMKDESPVFVLADRFRIRQVLTNLIVNSIKYGKEYGETSVKITGNNDWVKIDITDNGIGISPEHLPRLFERFYRVDKSRSREQGGTGLGLSIVKHIIEAHNQTISVTSKVGEGTTFAFTLKKA